MTIDCTLSKLVIPGFPEMVPEFGTKKADGVSSTARESAANAMLPFARQRPFSVTEDSDTTEIQAHTPFAIYADGVTLTLGKGGFAGCKVRVFNLSGGEAAVVYGEDGNSAVALADNRDVKLEWLDGAWKKVSGTASGGDSGSGAVSTPDGWGQYQEGRNLLEVLGAATPAEAMAILHERCNNGVSAANGEPDFSGLQIGDYIDGIDLSAIPAENGGDAGQVWDDTYKNNRIAISGFNTYLDAGDQGNGNVKNHILWTFENIPLRKKMNETHTNSGGYKASDLRVFLEGANGDGTGDKSGVTTAAFMNALKAQLGNYLYTIRKLHSIKSNNEWASYTVWTPSELEVFGCPHYGDEGVYLVADTATANATRAGSNTNVQFPIFASSYKHRIKRYNGARIWWWELTPYSGSATSFCDVNSTGNANSYLASSVGCCAPAFCVA
jgi:hypothetical protein